MVAEQSPLDLHNGNYTLSLDAPPVDEKTEFGFAAISIQTRQKPTNQPNRQKLFTSLHTRYTLICSFKIYFLDSPLSQGIRLFLLRTPIGIQL